MDWQSPGLLWSIKLSLISRLHVLFISNCLTLVWNKFIGKKGDYLLLLFQHHSRQNLLTSMSGFWATDRSGNSIWSTIWCHFFCVCYLQLFIHKPDRPHVHARSCVSAPPFYSQSSCPPDKRLQPLACLVLKWNSGGGVGLKTTRTTCSVAARP